MVEFKYPFSTNFLAIIINFTQNTLSAPFKQYLEFVLEEIKFKYYLINLEDHLKIFKAMQKAKFQNAEYIKKVLDYLVSENNFNDTAAKIFYIAAQLDIEPTE
jgi:hypothetical protein